ncbi:type II toxin-antitoxin system Phd/YefM family antitoxin [Sulfurivermis fontis]|uniref:type II toxin-antitoxin system Phd/YefM family antitoxin n=1 Tax=Sulfurivermis fontis TaxID=1972068 RepID=UPI000FDC5502|nr:type II toxin-antitoxin system prevent-host-death family antitoxin [Sulfurivermis fontis]
MDSTTISIADAKARLSELAELAASGKTVVITKRGKPVLQLSRPERPRQPVDVKVLRQLTAGLPQQPDDASSFVRRMRDEARY